MKTLLLILGIVFSILINYPLAALCQSTDSLKLIINKTPASEKATLLNNITRLYFARSLDSAQLYCDTALNYANQFSNITAKSMALKNQGVIYYFKGQYPEAIQYYQQAISFYHELSDSAGMAATWNNLAIIYEVQGDYENSINLHLKALYYYEKYGQPFEIARSCTNMGNALAAMNNHNKAIAYQQKALSIYLQLNDSLGIANSLNNLAAEYSEVQKYDSALRFHKNALEMRQRLKDSHGIVASLMNIGNALFNLKKFSESIPFIDSALIIANHIEDKKAIITILITKSNILIELKKYNEALIIIRTAEKMADAMKIPILKRDIYLNYANSYHGLKQYDIAFTYQARYIELKDSLVTRENAQYIANLESKYQFEKKNQQIQFQADQLVLKNNEIKKNRLIGLLTLVLLIAALGILVVISWSLRNKRRSHQRIEKQNELLTVQKKQITDSIHYAERIQNAMLPGENDLLEFFPSSFTIFLPKDIVSGDFIWIRRIGNQTAFALADCTGHGVPGSLMSMLGISFLNEMSLRTNIVEPGIILDEMRVFIKNSLSQSGAMGETKDGINIALYFFDDVNDMVSYASAYHPVFYFKQHIPITLNYDKQPVGVHYKEKPFTTFYQAIEKGDCFYFFSDGYLDQYNQFGNERFTKKRFCELISMNLNLPMPEQKNILLKNLNEWRGNGEQIDDISVVGIRF